MIAALIHTNYYTGTSARASPSSSTTSSGSSSEDELAPESEGEDLKSSKKSAVNGRKSQAVIKQNGNIGKLAAGRRVSDRHGATLVVAPTSLLNQWKDELRRTSKDRLSVLVYNDQKEISHLADELDGGVDVVIVSYGKMGIEFEKYASATTGGLAKRPKDGLYAINWYRIILDEVSSVLMASTCHLTSRDFYRRTTSNPGALELLKPAMLWKEDEGGA